jgi:hypothetical protein
VLGFLVVPGRDPGQRQNEE